MTRQNLVYGGFTNRILKKDENFDELRVVVKDYRCHSSEVQDRANLFDIYLDKKGMVKDQHRGNPLLQKFMHMDLVKNR